MTAPSGQARDPAGTASLAFGIAAAVPWVLLQYRPAAGLPHRYATFVEFDPFAGMLHVAVFWIALIGGVLASVLGGRALSRRIGPPTAAWVGVTLGLVSLIAYALPALPQILDVLTGITLGPVR